MTDTPKQRRGPRTASELMAELERNPEWLKARAERLNAHRARQQDNAEEFAFVRRTLEAAGVPGEDFGRFTSGRHPDVIRPSVFDFRSAVPVLLTLLPLVSKPAVKESIVRSLSTRYARPVAADALIDEFRRTSVAEQPALKWAIGNALDTVTTPTHLDALLELVLDRSHGTGRQMIVNRIARISSDARVVGTLLRLIDDEDVAFNAMAGLRRRLGPSAAAERIRPLMDHPSQRIRDAAQQQMRRALKDMKKTAT